MRWPGLGNTVAIEFSENAITTTKLYGISAAGNEFENRKVLEAAVAASSSSSTYFGQQIENHHHHSPLAKEHQGGNSVKARLSQFIDSGFQYTILQPLLILLLLGVEWWKIPQKRNAVHRRNKFITAN